jgi:hypothetical protein
MSKIVVDFEPSQNPQKDDLFVYNPSRNCWEQVSKIYLFKEIEEKLKEQQKEIENLKADNEVFKKDISTLAKILKGEIK